MGLYASFTAFKVPRVLQSETDKGTFKGGVAQSLCCLHVLRTSAQMRAFRAGLNSGPTSHHQGARNSWKKKHVSADIHNRQGFQNKLLRSENFGLNHRSLCPSPHEHFGIFMQTRLQQKCATSV